MTQGTETAPPVPPSMPTQQGDSITSIILATAYLLGIILNRRK